jgi:glycerophosphoryl diester phosphodiesterase
VTLKIGHRGAAAVAPENTLASFRRAVELGADAVEFDLHRTRDGRFVVIHDDTLDRTTDGRGWVADHTWADIGRLDAGAWFDRGQFAGERVPRLAEVLDWAKGARMPLAIELKRPNAALGRPRYAGLPERVVRLVRERDLADLVLLHSDNHWDMREVKRLAPEIATAVAVGGADYIDLVGIVRAAGANGLTIHWRFVDRPLADLVHRAGLHLFGYGIHEDLSQPEEVYALLANDADILSSNYPDRLRRMVEDWRRSRTLAVPSKE